MKRGNRVGAAADLTIALSAAALILLVAVAPASGQDVDPQTCAQGTVACDAARKDRSDKEAAAEQEQQQMAAARMVQARALLTTPALPAERNGLLGSWRLGDGQRSTIGLGVLTGDAELGELLEAFQSLDKFGCEVDWGGGITFTPLTYSSGETFGVVEGKGGPIAYRSANRGVSQVVVAITDYYHMMAFQIAGPDRIVDGNGCVLVRVGAPAVSAAANTADAPGNARTAAATTTSPEAAALPQVAAVAPLSTVTYAPVDPRSALGQGIALHREKDFQPALQQFLAATTANPNDARGWVFLADTYGWLGLERDGEAAFAKALKLDPNASSLLR